MTASRIQQKELSPTYWVSVQANWNAVDITDANGGVFVAPVTNVGPYTLVSWVFRFAALTNGGVSGTLTLTGIGFPDAIPDQWGGRIAQRGASSYVGTSADVVYASGRFITTIALNAARATTLTATLANANLNF